MNMAENYYDANAYEEFTEVRDKITYKLDSLIEEIKDDYGFELRYDDIYLLHPNERIIYIT